MQKKVSKADAFKALEDILDGAMLNQYQHAEDIITLTRFIEQQYDYEGSFGESHEKAEGTI